MQTLSYMASPQSISLAYSVLKISKVAFVVTADCTACSNLAK